MTTLEPGNLPGGSIEPAVGKGEMTAQGIKRRILVVEDEMLIAMLLEDMLAELGHEVTGVAPRVSEALAAVSRDDYDLAILDLHLNGQSAFPVADALIERGKPFAFATG